jgi:hypothetical protein
MRSLGIRELLRIPPERRALLGDGEPRPIDAI